MDQIKFYKSNQIVNPIFLSIWLVMCLVFIIFISYYYSFFSSIIPIIYFCIVVTIGFGMAIGYFIRFSSKLFIITNKKLIYYASILSSLFALYFSWLSYVLLLTPNSQEIYFFNPTIWIEFSQLFDSISVINEHGLWGFFGANLTGYPLAFIWLAEAIFIILIPLAIIKGYKLSPHSSRLNKWYKRYELKKQFQGIVGISNANERISNNPCDYLESLSTGEIIRHSKATISYLEDENPQYITFINYRINKEGKILSKDIAIENQEISKNDAKIILEKYHEEKLFFFD